MKKLKTMLAVVLCFSLLFSLGVSASAMEPVPDLLAADFGPGEILWPDYDDDYDFDYESYWKEELRKEKIAFGGDPDGYNVMVNGECIQFGAAKPEMKNKRLFVPADSLLKAVGAQSSSAGTQLTASLDGKTIQHTVGTASLTVTEGQTTQSIEMDAASFQRSGTTMVPVRFLAEAFGLYVEWDWYYETAVVLDLDQIIDQIDGQFSLLNQLFKTPLKEEGKTYQSVGNVQLDWTAFDSMNGDKTYSATAKLESLQNSEAANLALTMDLSDFAELFAAEYYIGEDDEALEYLKSIIKAEAIYLPGDGTLFATITGLPENTWAKTNISELVQMMQWDKDCDLTVGSLLWNLECYGYSDPVYYYQKLQDASAEMALWLGDDGFQKSGVSYTRTWDNKTIAALMWQGLSEVDRQWYESYLDEYYDYFGSYEEAYAAMMLGAEDVLDAKLTLTQNSNGTCSYDLSLKMTDGEFMMMDITAKQTNTSAQVQAKLHIKNVGELAMKLNSTTQQSSKPVKTEPPKNAVILEG